jgi:pimeloyl-ACP methyl ester carboxylesterase
VKEGQGPGVLLIHGFGGHRDVWKPLAPALARTHTLVRVDLPGSGGSAGPALKDGAADLEAIAKDLAALVRREGLAPCLVVGHSMGGPIAALAVLQDPSAFRGLVLVDSFLGAVPPEYLAATITGLEKDPAAALSAFFGPMTTDGEQTARLVKDAGRIPAHVLQAYLRGLSRDNLAGRQSQLTLPVVQFQAGPEGADPAKRAELLAQLGLSGIQGLRVVPFPKAKHWIMWDEPEAFMKALLAFERDPSQP